jgi:hypothetical protein
MGILKVGFNMIMVYHSIKANILTAMNLKTPGMQNLVLVVILLFLTQMRLSEQEKTGTQAKKLLYMMNRVILPFIIMRIRRKQFGRLAKMIIH